LGHKLADFPVAGQYQNEILSLPMFPELEKSTIGHVVSEIARFFN
jgi:dTDP-4-amino-4,6-dideoxygalactose transaminase